jgi:hypothetical protein
MLDHQPPPAVADRLDRRDLIVRLVSVVGLVGLALALLLVVKPS